jgi:hypothetical protein
VIFFNLRYFGSTFGEKKSYLNEPATKTYIFFLCIHHESIFEFDNFFYFDLQEVEAVEKDKHKSK